jgi:hypothetical protein
MSTKSYQGKEKLLNCLKTKQLLKKVRLMDLAAPCDRCNRSSLTDRPVWGRRNIHTSHSYPTVGISYNLRAWTVKNRLVSEKSDDKAAVHVRKTRFKWLYYFTVIQNISTCLLTSQLLPLFIRLKNVKTNFISKLKGPHNKSRAPCNVIFF